MRLALVGLGKMGGNMAERLLSGGHEVIGMNRSLEPRERLASLGGVAVSSLEEVIEALPPRRAIWLMIPAGSPVESTIEALLPMLAPDDVVIDGGNSFYKDTVRRAEWLNGKGIRYVDVGTSGGVWGLAEGYSMMVGGEEDVIDFLRPVLETLAPAADRGWDRVGKSGAGHFVKMVHNGIEYGMMQAYAEGFAILGKKTEFDLDLHRVAEIWRHGSVVRSWLLDLTARALEENPGMDGIAPWVFDSGEGRWTLFEAVDLEVPAPVISLALIQRLRSRDPESFSDRLLAAMRNQFGGHAVKEER